MDAFYIDIILCVIVLLFGVAGLFVGLFKSIFSLVGFAGCATLAYFLKDWVTNILNQLFNLTSSLANLITTKFAEAYAPLAHSFAVDKAGLLSIVEASPINGLIKWFMNLAINNSNITSEVAVTDVVSPFLANIIVMVISILIVFILASCIVLILKVAFSKLTKGTTLGFIDRLLGFVLGLVKGGVFIFVCLVILNALCLIPPIGNAVMPFLEGTTITQWGFDMVNNLFRSIIT